MTRAPAAAPPSDDHETQLGGPTPVPGGRARSGVRRPGTRAGQTQGGPAEAATDLVGQDLGDRYHIIKLLGAGGMGAVYQAWDGELGVAVALKTVRPEVAADPATARMLEQRFKQELLLARKVTHKNIVRVHDIGELDGLKYITMPYLEGEDLATILKREGKLPVDRVMIIARSVASGLAEAHKAGVVHRDLKPANIMVDKEGEGLVMDFGVARSTAGPAPSGGAAGTFPAGAGRAVAAAHTMVGSVVGTVEYMAPEQARAEAVDQRADIYAFGLILYDLLLGRIRAQKTASAIAELQGRMQESPPPPRTLDPTIPVALDKLIARCIQVDPAKRFATTQDLLGELAKLDDKGKPVPVIKRLSRPMKAAMAAGVALLVGGTYYLARGPAIPVEHPPVAVVIADFKNETGDAAFNGTVEPLVKMGLEDAGFISAFDRSAIGRTMGVRPPEILDEKAAVELAVKQGVGVVLSGTLTKDGNRFRVAVKAAEAVSGNMIAEEAETASTKDGVLAAVASVTSEVRQALGDDRSDSMQRFVKDTLSATSLDAVRSYSKAMEALSRNQFDEAFRAFSETAAKDPKFGLAYGGMAIASANLGRRQDAEKYAKEALGLVDGMTERERYRTRAMYYSVTSDYQPCVKEYGDLIAKYPADTAARNNRANCLGRLRDMTAAAEEMRQAVKLLPNRTLFRVNLATYAAYMGDTATAEEESRKIVAETPWALQPLVMAQTLENRLSQAAQTFRDMEKHEELGPYYTASGLGDLAVYQGRFADAARIFTESVAAQIAAKDADRAGAKLAALAYTELLRDRKAEAIAAAERALEASQTRGVRFLAARVLIEAGEPQRARPIAVALGNDLLPEAQALASILDGMIASADGDNRNAIRFLTEANTLLDTWIGHFELGRAYLRANQFLQADSEFDRCVTRRPEALGLFLDDEPTFGYFPAVHYYQGQAREGLKSTRAGESFKAYLAIRGQSKDDPLVPEIRQRVGTN